MALDLSRTAAMKLNKLDTNSTKGKFLRGMNTMIPNPSGRNSNAAVGMEDRAPKPLGEKITKPGSAADPKVRARNRRALRPAKPAIGGLNPISNGAIKPIEPVNRKIKLMAAKSLKG